MWLRVCQEIQFPYVPYLFTQVHVVLQICYIYFLTKVHGLQRASPRVIGHELRQAAQMSQMPQFLQVLLPEH